MAFTFPSNPTQNAIYTYGNKTWRWNGVAWQTYYPISVPSAALSRIDLGSANTSTSFVTMDPLLSNLDMANGGIVISKGEGIYANGSYGSVGNILMADGVGGVSWKLPPIAFNYYLATA